MRLECVLFQRDLGTLAEKQTRISEVAQTLSQTLGADRSTVRAAGGLIKADLVSDDANHDFDFRPIADSCSRYFKPAIDSLTKL